MCNFIDAKISTILLSEAKKPARENINRVGKWFLFWGTANPFRADGDEIGLEIEVSLEINNRKMTRTAREIFTASPQRGEWEKLVQLPVFEGACQAALLMFVESQPTTGGAADGWDRHSRLCGARDLLEILKTMHLPAEKKPEGPKRPTLNYNVK